MLRLYNTAFGDGYAGSAAALVTGAGSAGGGVLSACHVLMPCRLGTAPGAEGAVRITGGSGRDIDATVANWLAPLGADGLALDNGDAAWATVAKQDFEMLAAEMPLPEGLNFALQGQSVCFLDAASGNVRKTIVHSDRAAIDMHYFVWGVGLNPQGRAFTAKWLSQLIQCEADALLTPGDSGGLLFDEDGFALGIAIGLDKEGRYSYFAHLGAVLDAFRLKLVDIGTRPGGKRLSHLLR
jgi:hypothetical protein